MTSKSSRDDGEPGPSAVRSMADLKRDARTNFAPGSPYRVAMEALPDEMPRHEFVLHLRVLLPMLRLEGSR